MTTRLPHTVTVTPRRNTDGTLGEPKVTFECPWQYGECHFYPDCDCETWSENHYRDHGAGHHREHHDECWMQAWFDAGCTGYAGEDHDDMTDTGIPPDMNRTGTITAQFDYDYVEWWFTT